MTCSQPYLIQDTGETVACGKCHHCRKQYVNKWAFRIEKAMQSHDFIDCYFVTLTYDSEHVPGDYSLQYEHIKLWLKRLRYYTNERLKKLLGKGWHKPKITYYAAGEKGARFGRPHWHVILMGAAIRDIQDSWQMGRVDIRPLRDGAIQYALKYVYDNPKKASNQLIRGMSKGIGLEWLNRSLRAMANKPEQYLILKKPDGKLVSIPRYYKEKAIQAGAWEKEEIALLVAEKLRDQEPDYDRALRAEAMKAKVQKLNSYYYQKSIQNETDENG